MSTGSYRADDANGLRSDLAANPANCEASATFRTVTSASGQFQLTKTVQGDYDTAPQQFPAVGHVKLTDGVADYAITWQNTGAPTLEGVVLYDVFPHVGDTGVSEAQAAEQRDSEFQPLLAAVGTAPTGVTIAYSASANPCRPEVYPGQGACVDDWTTDPGTLGGLSNVMAIRLVSGEEYVTGAGFSLGFQMSVPTVDKDIVAWNSVAGFGQTTTGVALLPTESPKVGITASDDRFTLDKEVGAAAAVPGDELEYTVTVGNTGTRDSVPTTVVDTLPVGLTFVSADNGGVYDPAARTVTWSIPPLARDTTLELAIVATVEQQQNDGEIVNRAMIFDPAGYSPTIVDSPCAADASRSCARTTVPASVAALAHAGIDLPAGVLAGALLLLAAGAALLGIKLRRTRQS